MVSLGSNIGHWQKRDHECPVEPLKVIPAVFKPGIILRIFFAVLMTTLYAMISFVALTGILGPNRLLASLQIFKIA